MLANGRERLSKYIINLRKGNTIEVEDETILMKELIKDFGTFSGARNGSSHTKSDMGKESSEGEVVVSLSITGVHYFLTTKRFLPALLVLLALTSSIDFVQIL